MPERFAWTDEETRYFLNLIEENDITTIFYEKRQRKATTIQDLERKWLHEAVAYSSQQMESAETV